MYVSSSLNMFHRVDHRVWNAKGGEEALRPVDRPGWIHLGWGGDFIWIHFFKLAYEGVLVSLSLD